MGLLHTHSHIDEQVAAAVADYIREINLWKERADSAEIAYKTLRQWYKGEPLGTPLLDEMIAGYEMARMIEDG